MKRFVRMAGRVVLALALLALVAVGAGYLHARRAWPRTEGTLALSGLRGPVSVYRDAWGVPLIFAADEHDLFFAQGFVHAQDRLWQMHLGRALGRGELAALFGEPALPSDRMVRTLGLRRAGEQALLLLEPDTRAAAEAYSEGVNAFLDGDPTLPIEFALLGAKPARWEPLDSMLVGENIALAMSLDFPFELLRVRLAAVVGEARTRELLPSYPPGFPVTLPDHHEAPRAAGRADLAALLGALSGHPWGSNAWVVHGSRSATGKPLLANDMHLGLPLPSIWYENALSAGRYAVAGFSLPGAPFVAAGHNRRVAWGLTSMCSDVQDLYREKIEGDRYLYQDAWVPLSVSFESVPVKGKPPVRLRIASTRHGPLINEAFATLGADRLPPLSLRWAAREGGTLFNALAALDRAQGWSDFHGALAGWHSPSLNFLYADVDGNIAYQSTGRIPIRAQGHEGFFPAEGWTGTSEWQGFIPYEDLPSRVNPPEGYLVSANNKVVPDSYPFHLAQAWGDPYRAARITQVLAANPRVTLEDMRALQADTFSLPAQALRPYLMKVQPAGELEARAKALMEGWDLRLEARSAAAAIYFVWYTHLLDETLGDELGAFWKDFRAEAMRETPLLVELMAKGDSPWFDDVRTPQKETRDQISARAWHQTVAYLAERFGAEPSEWEWGKLHTMSFVHLPLGRSGIRPLELLFNSRPVPASGDPFTVNATVNDPGVTYAVVSGPAQRFLADLSALERSRSSTTTGQSGLLFHPHREDQAEPWSRVEHHPMLFERAAAAAAKELLTLVPRGGTAIARKREGSPDPGQRDER